MRQAVVRRMPAIRDALIFLAYGQSSTAASKSHLRLGDLSCRKSQRNIGAKSK